jgi:hypothetical protein
MIKRLIQTGGLISLLTGIGLTPALAATKSAPAPTPQSGQALEISPTVQELNVDPGRVLTETIQVHNISRTNQVVTGEIDDFTPNGETGLPKIQLDTNGSGPYSLKRWAVLPGKITLVPRQIAALTVKFYVPASATPGSHYGILRFTAAPPGLEGTGVSISTSVGVLEILRVSGAVKEDLKTVELSMRKTLNDQPSTFFESAPFYFSERLSNTGNADLTPEGGIDIYDMFGRKTAFVPVNQPPHLILPGSIRRFDEILDSGTLGTKHLFGHYTGKMKLTYGNSKQVLTATIGFWVIPYKLIITFIILAAIIVLLLRWAAKKYNIQISRR